jgi:hypothetical protein
VNAGWAVEKAAKKEAAAALLTKTDDKDKESEKGGAKLGKGAHA